MDVNVTTLKASGMGSGLFGSMAIFQDPAYLTVATMGGVIALFLAWYDIDMEKRKLGIDFKKSIKFETIKAFIIGFTFSLLIFVALVLHSDDVVQLLNPKAKEFLKITPTLAIGVTLVLSTYVVKFWEFSSRRLK